MIRHYEGKLGVFDYDDTQFELQTLWDNPYSTEPGSRRTEYLIYIGNESDGSNIIIPEGIYDCSRMFFECTFLESTPLIPDYVGLLKYTFAHCTSLTKVTNIPKFASLTIGMFEGCTSLVIVPDLPYFNNFYLENKDNTLYLPPVYTFNEKVYYWYGITDASYMFKDCTSLIKAPRLNWQLNIMCYMFENCISLEETTEDFPQAAKNCKGMYKGCSSLINPPSIRADVWALWQCSEMFSGCTSLIKLPILPKSITDAYKMFCDCISLISVDDLNEGYEDCRYMFMNCTSLEYGKKAPEGANDEGMYKGCSPSLIIT